VFDYLEEWEMEKEMDLIVSQAKQDIEQLMLDSISEELWAKNRVDEFRKNALKLDIFKQQIAMLLLHIEK